MRPSPVSGTTPPVESRWKPGQSGNPTGRPKALVSRHVRRLLRQAGDEEAKHLALALVEQAKKDPAMMRILLDRMEGPVENVHRHSGDVGPAVVIEVVDAERPDDAQNAGDV